MVRGQVHRGAIDCVLRKVAKTDNGYRFHRRPKNVAGFGRRALSCVLINATIVLNMRTCAKRIARSLPEVLFGAYRRQVLALLLLHPDESHYVREISRLTNVSAGSLHRELKLLADAGLLLRAPVGNQVRYSANRDCPIFEELAGIFRKTAGLADVLRKALVTLGSGVDLALVFGSVAAGTEEASSDADVLVVGAVPFVKVVKALSACKDQLHRDVNPVVMTRADFQTKLQRGDRFLTRVAREPKILLIGDTDDFARLAEDRAT
jgi:predicted nucleotidyltransferase